MAENDDAPETAEPATGEGAATSEPIDADFEPVGGKPAREPRYITRATAAVFALIAAVVGGLIGVVFDRSGDTRGVRNSLAALETRLNDLDAGGSGAGAQDLEALGARLDEAATRLTSLEAAGASGGDPGVASALASRMDALAGDAAEAMRIARAANEAPRASPSEVAALSGRVATIDARSAQAENRLADLDLRVAALDARESSQDAAIAQVGEATASLAGRLTGVTTSAGRRGAGAAAALAVADLQNAAEAGRPFAAELDAVRPHVEDDAIVAQLDRLAEAGVASRGQLASMFGAVAREARGAERASSGGVVDVMSRAIADVVTVRRLDAPQSGATGDILARAQSRLAADDLSAAAAEMERLSGPARASAEGWIERARQRLALDAALVALRGHLADG